MRSVWIKRDRIIGHARRTARCIRRFGSWIETTENKKIPRKAKKEPVEFSAGSFFKHPYVTLQLCRQVYSSMQSMVSSVAMVMGTLI